MPLRTSSAKVRCTQSYVRSSGRRVLARGRHCSDAHSSEFFSYIQPSIHATACPWYSVMSSVRFPTPIPRLEPGAAKGAHLDERGTLGVLHLQTLAATAHSWASAAYAHGLALATATANACGHALGLYLDLGALGSRWSQQELEGEVVLGRCC
jgi:hypothetical protein